QPAPQSSVEMPSAEPAATQDVSLVKPEPRVIDMIDDTATAAINPAVAGFSRPEIATTPMPPTLLASTGPAATVPLDAPADPAEVTGSISDTVAARQSFEL